MNGEYELGLLSCLLKHPSYIRDHGNLLLERHFCHPYGKKYLGILKDCYDLHRELPTKPEFEELVTKLSVLDNLGPEVTETLLQDAEKIYTLRVTGSSKDSIEEFITQKTLESFGETLISADYGSDNRRKLLDTMQSKVIGLQRLNAGNDTRKISYLLEGGTLKEFIQTAEYRQKAGTATTGIPRLDVLLGGGTCPGEYTILAAPSGRGKTAVLINSGVASLLQGMRVLHVSLDESEQDIKARYLIRLSGIAGLGKSAYVSEEDLIKALAPYEKFMKNLLIWSAPNETISCMDILEEVQRIQAELYYHDLENGIAPEKAGKVHKIITDYSTKTKSWMSRTKGADPGWDRIRYASEEHQHLARTLDVDVWSAVQGNKEMAMSEFGQLTNIAMGYAGVAAVTNCFIICQLQADLHEQPAPLWLYAAKTRSENGLYLVPILYNKSKQLIWDNTEIEVDTIDSTINKTAKPMKYSAEEAATKRKHVTVNSSKINPNYESQEGYEAVEEIRTATKWQNRKIKNSTAEEPETLDDVLPKPKGRSKPLSRRIYEEEED